MSNLKESIIKSIQENKYFQQVCTFSIDSTEKLYAVNNISIPASTNSAFIIGAPVGTTISLYGKNLLDPTGFSNRYSVNSNGQINSSISSDTRHWYYHNCDMYTSLKAGKYALTVSADIFPHYNNSYESIAIFDQYNNQLLFLSFIGMTTTTTMNFTVTQDCSIGILLKAYYCTNLTIMIRKCDQDGNILGGEEYTQFVCNSIVISDTTEFPIEIPLYDEITNIISNNNIDIEY